MPEEKDPIRPYLEACKRLTRATQALDRIKEQIDGVASRLQQGWQQIVQEEGSGQKLTTSGLQEQRIFTSLWPSYETIQKALKEWNEAKAAKDQAWKNVSKEDQAELSRQDTRSKQPHSLG
jgi:hypothetical protein